MDENDRVGRLEEHLQGESPKQFQEPRKHQTFINVRNVGEMSEHLRGLAAIEDLGSIPSTYIR